MALLTARRALTDSALALLVAAVCACQFVPPLLSATVSSPLRAGLTGALLAAALLMHWLWLARGTRRMGRSVSGWLALGALFPVGGAAALLLLLGCLDEPAPAPAPAR